MHFAILGPTTILINNNLTTRLSFINKMVSVGVSISMVSTIVSKMCTQPTPPQTEILIFRRPSPPFMKFQHFLAHIHYLLSVRICTIVSEIYTQPPPPQTAIN